jgi:hypothetical protein
MAYTTPLNAKKTDELGTPVTVYPQGGGQSYTGYIKNGLTYTDPQGTNRVPIGSKVNTADGKQYQLTSYGGVETYPSAINSLKKSQNDAIGGFYKARNERNAGYNAAAAAAERSYRDRVAQLERDTQLANEQARKAYIEAQNPFGVIAQRNEALGLGDSGYAESTMAALSNEYQRQLNENNRNKQDALADIYAAIEAAKAEAEFNKAMNNAATLEAITAQRAQNAESLMQHNTNAYNTGINMDNYKDEIAYARGRDALNDKIREEETAWGRAWEKVKHGYIDADVAKAINMSEAEARAIYNTHYAPQIITQGSGAYRGNKQANDYEGIASTEIFDKIKQSGGDAAVWLALNGKKYGITNDDDKAAIIAGYKNWISKGFETPNGVQYDPEDIKGVDENSILMLGRGMLSAKQLDELVKKGIVEEYIENGYLKYRNKGTVVGISKNGNIINSGMPTIIR